MSFTALKFEECLYKKTVFLLILHNNNVFYPHLKTFKAIFIFVIVETNLEHTFRISRDGYPPLVFYVWFIFS